MQNQCKKPMQNQCKKPMQNSSKNPMCHIEKSLNEEAVVTLLLNKSAMARKLKNYFVHSVAPNCLHKLPRCMFCHRDVPRLGFLLPSSAAKKKKNVRYVRKHKLKKFWKVDFTINHQLKIIGRLENLPRILFGQLEKILVDRR